jgi:hypothetical protein
MESIAKSHPASGLIRFFRSHGSLADLCLAAGFSFAVCLLTCTSLSPLYPAENCDYLNGDSNLFRYMAWLWLQGKTPYIDFYDHKGLYHLAIDALGLLIGGRYGIWFLEIIFSALNLFVLARCVRLLKGDGIRWRMLLYGLYFLLFSFLGQGNSEGEWVLPFVNLYLFGYLNGLAKMKKGYFLLGSFFMGLEVGLALNSRPLDALWGGVGAAYFAIYCLKRRKWGELLQNGLVSLAGLAIPLAIFYGLALKGGYFAEMMEAIFLMNGSYFLRQFSSFEILPALNRLLTVLAMAYCIVSYHFLRKNMADRKDLNFYFFFVAMSVSLIYLVILGYFHYFQAGFGFFCLYVIYLISALPPLKNREWGNLISKTAFLLAVVYDLVFVVGYYTVGIYDFSYWGSKQIEADVLAIPEEDRKTPGRVFAIDLDASIYFDGGIVAEERFLAYTTWWAQDNEAVVPEIVAYLSGAEKPKWLLVLADDANMAIFGDAISSNYDYYSQPNQTFVIYSAKTYS